MAKKTKTDDKPVSFVQAVALGIVIVVGFTAFIAIKPKLEEIMQSWRIQQDRQESVSGCQYTQEKELARAVLCPEGEK